MFNDYCRMRKQKYEDIKINQITDYAGSGRCGRAVFVIFIITVFLFTSAGCVSLRPGDNTGFEKRGVLGTTTMEKQTVKGEITVYTDKFPALNPYNCSNYYITGVLQLIYEGLISIDSKKTITPVLAESWRAEKNNKEWTFYIRKEARWHNGKKVTASDVIYSINCLKTNTGNGIYKQCVDNISGTAGSGKKVVINLFRSDPGFYENMIFPIVSKKIGLSASIKKPLGSGPYKYKSINKRKMVLARNSEWYRGILLKGDYDGVQPPFIKRINVVNFQTSQNGVGAFMKNELDIFPISTKDYKKLNKYARFSQTKYFTNKYDFISFNTTSKQLSSANVRKAIAHYIDRNDIINYVYNGNAALSDIPVIPSSFGKGEIVYKNNDEKAYGYLVDDGWLRPYGKWQKSGMGYLSPELLVNNSNKAHMKIAERIKSLLDEKGIIVRVKAVSKETYRSSLETGRYQMAVAGYNLSGGLDFSYAAAPAANGGFLNFTGFEDEEYVAKYNSRRVTTDQRESNILYEELKGIWLSNLPSFGLCIQTGQIAVSRRLYGDLGSTYRNPYVNLPFSYITF